MNQCQTKPLLFKEVSGCLVEKPECGYAHRFGFSIVCCHPEHARFHAHLAGEMTSEAMCALYETLRQKRQDEFMETLDEEFKDIFRLRFDFHGRPLDDTDSNAQRPS